MQYYTLLGYNYCYSVFKRYTKNFLSIFAQLMTTLDSFCFKSR